MYIVMNIKPLTYRPLAFRSVAPLDYPQPVTRCSGCREQIMGQPSRDEHQVPYHVGCLLKRKEATNAVA